MSKKLKIFLLGLVILIVSFIGIAAFKLNEIINTVNSDKIYTKITINDVDVSGLSKDEAFKKVLESDTKVFSVPILNIYYKDINKDLYYDDIMASNNVQELIDKAYDIGREGALFDRYAVITKLKKTPQNFQISYLPDKEKIFKTIDSLKEKIETTPINATMKKDKMQSFVVTPGKTGTQINKDKTFEAIQNAIKKKESKVKIIVDSINPQYTKNALAEIQTPLATYTTKFNRYDKSRTNNLQVATSFIDSSLVKPGETFSVNNAIKSRTAANGYQSAHVIVNGQLVDGIGGGICQVATTLYNAVMIADLKVVERHNHSLTSTYVSPGRDATVSGSYLDFKFQNTTNKQLYIQGYLDGGTLTYTIYGDAAAVPKNRIDFEYAVVKRISPPPEKVTEDPTMDLGKRKVTTKAKEGMVVKLYKLIYDANNVLLKKEYVSQSTYRATQAEVLVGTKQLVEVPVME
ncbi:MAG: hypothetical protein A2Y24_04875 [Clostridiales bacterium GWE2_32_10]|nr:MAG: hypothetical protein A2Y24_04875 [Clostridiales bacterium GWE2_32_10]